MQVISKRVPALLFVLLILFAAVYPSAAPASEAPTALELSGGEFGKGYKDHDGQYYDGTGQIIVLIQAAFQEDHVNYGDRVIEEVCFGDNRPRGVTTGNQCRGPVQEYKPGSGFVFQTGKGVSRYDYTCKDLSDKDRPFRVFGDAHGTLAAGAAAGAAQNTSGPVGRTSGIAPGSQLILIKVGACGGMNFSSVAPALEYVSEELVPKYNQRIAAVNVALGASWDKSPTWVHVKDEQSCSSVPNYTELKKYEDAALKVKQAGAQVVASADNRFMTDSIGLWACSENVVGVGATDVNNLNELTVYSNASKRVDLLTPVGIGEAPNRLEFSTAVAYTAQPHEEGNDLFSTPTGTSFSAPQVTGAYAVLRQKWPNASVDELTELLQRTGVRVQDTRPGNTGIIAPRMVLGEAIRDRTYRPAFDFTRDYSTDFFMISDASGNLLRGTVGADGKIGTSFPQVPGDWKEKRFVAPVRDFLSNGTNGFISTDGEDLTYQQFDEVAGKFADQSITVARGGASNILGAAGLNDLSLPGTGKGVVLQKSDDKLVYRLLKPETSNLYGEVPIPTNSLRKLVGVADINSDGYPDIILRDASTNLPYALFGTGDTVQPFSTDEVALATGTYWSRATQMWVMDDFTQSSPALGYVDSTHKKIFAYKFDQSGQIDTANWWQVAPWGPDYDLIQAP